MISLRYLMLIALLLCSPINSFAGEEGLYPSAPPAGSAFIRFFNGHIPTGLAIKIRGKSYGTASMEKISAYAPVPQGDTNLSIGSEATSINLKEGDYYMIMLVHGKLYILKEPPNSNKIKAQIILINASNTPAISLKTADGLTTIVDSVDTLKLGGRAVNAIKVPFSVYASKNKIGDLDAHFLERGARYTIVVYDAPNGKPTIIFN